MVHNGAPLLTAIVLRNFKHQLGQHAFSSYPGQHFKHLRCYNSAAVFFYLMWFLNLKKLDFFVTPQIQVGYSKCCQLWFAWRWSKAREIHFLQKFFFCLQFINNSVKYWTQRKWNVHQNKVCTGEYILFIGNHICQQQLSIRIYCGTKIRLLCCCCIKCEWGGQSKYVHVYPQVVLLISLAIASIWMGTEL